jgi:hypothetical protein
MNSHRKKSDIKLNQLNLKGNMNKDNELYSSSDNSPIYVEEIDSILFKDEYVVIVSTHKTYVIKYSELGDVSQGWKDNIQACALSIAHFPQKKKQYPPKEQTTPRTSTISKHSKNVMEPTRNCKCKGITPCKCPTSDSPYVS